MPYSRLRLESAAGKRRGGGGKRRWEAELLGMEQIHLSLSQENGAAKFRLRHGNDGEVPRTKTTNQLS